MLNRIVNTFEDKEKSWSYLLKALMWIDKAWWTYDVKENWDYYTVDYETDKVYWNLIWTRCKSWNYNIFNIYYKKWI